MSFLIKEDFKLISSSVHKTAVDNCNLAMASVVALSKRKLFNILPLKDRYVISFAGGTLDDNTAPTRYHDYKNRCVVYAESKDDLQNIYKNLLDLNLSALRREFRERLKEHNKSLILKGGK